MSVRDAGWTLFDAIVATAALRDVNPWLRTGTAAPVFEPDYETLTRLLGVPVKLKATSQSGVPALAFDVWAAYEFRRAGFNPDSVWPRASAPRVLPAEVATLLASLPRTMRIDVEKRLGPGGAMKGLPGASATILGKNYVKQVDVGMSSWRTGPELLISTKRMDSSFGKNAANRVEESYGDVKNLRLRHPQAALGFLYGLRSTALTEEPDKADWLRDLLTKLGREDDAYDAVALVVPEWPAEDRLGDNDDDSPTENAFIAAGLDVALETTNAEGQYALDQADIGDEIGSLPAVVLRHDAVPPELSPARFFDVLSRRVLDSCPVNFHRDARARYGHPR